MICCRKSVNPLVYYTFYLWQNSLHKVEELATKTRAENVFLVHK